MAQQIAGTLFIRADGVQFSVGGTVTISPDAVEREGLVGLSGVVGYKETFRVPAIEFESFATPETDFAALEEICDATVTAELANGQIYVLSNAWSSGFREIDGAEGTFTMRFEGKRMSRTNI